MLSREAADGQHAVQSSSAVCSQGGRPMYLLLSSICLATAACVWLSREGQEDGPAKLSQALPHEQPVEA